MGKGETIGDFLSSTRNLIAIVLFVGIIQVVVCSIAGSLASVNGSMPVPQSDTLLYCQAARRIAEGHPFSYSFGEKMSTGTTSVLYPFVLAVPYFLGAHGASLITAGFWLNSAFYLLFLLGWSIAFCRWTEAGWKRAFACLMLPLSAQPLICAVSQSDTGLMMAVSAVFAWGYSMRKKWLYGLALGMLPWVRPEGMMCVFGVVAVLVVREICARHGRLARPQRIEWMIAAASVLSLACVFALNFLLTGEAQFSSVANKGYFNNIPFASAVVQSFSDLCKLVRAYFCGCSEGDFRDLIVIPFWGGIAFFIGLLSYWKDRTSTGSVQSILVFGVAGLLSFASVAVSAWQGSNFDRYLAWCQPLRVFFVAVGVMELGVWVGGAARWLAPAMVAVYCVGMNVAAACAFNCGCLQADRYYQFAQQIDRAVPGEASVGGALCTAAYAFEDRRFRHFGGLYSPDFMCRGRVDAAEVIERLRHHAELRPDYLVVKNPDAYSGLSPEEMDKVGIQVLVGPDGLELRKACWQPFDDSLTAVFAPTGKSLVATVDVGYDQDEKASSLRIYDRWNRRQGDPFVRCGRLGGRDVIDCGRGVIGCVEMSVPLHAGRDAVVVVRALRKGNVAFNDGMGNARTGFVLSDESLAFRISVDGGEPFAVDVDKWSRTAGDDDFVEFALTIPGRRIARGGGRICIFGDHLSCGYRFYQ